MLFTVLRRQLQVPLLKTVSGIRLSGSSLFLAFGAIIAFSTSASAVETVTLVFNESRVSVPFRDFQTFVMTGETQRTDLQNIFGKLPRTSQALRTALTHEIVITRPFSRQNFRNPTTDFLLLQLNNVLTSVTIPDNLEPLRTALATSYRNNQQISILEVIGNYPEDEIVVQLPRVERAYNRASAFVERVQPAVETLRLFLQNLMCNCPVDSTSSEVVTPRQVSEDGSVASAKAVKCP
ncbi:MAG: alpha/beta hydrolase [Chroococcidiopsidaceae cyanobacterium CP_BM_ER_R8_30]|nr:alpha/beta hydrolase [Chroococcidiopsidaceae cyanobacterium CP_BM_ER_R8_30]